MKAFTARRVLGVSVVATLAIGAIIAVYVAQLIPGSRYLGLLVAQIGLGLALIGIAGAVAVGVAVIRWRDARVRSWGVRAAVAEALYLAFVGSLTGQVYLVLVSAAYGWGAYQASRSMAEVDATERRPSAPPPSVFTALRVLGVAVIATLAIGIIVAVYTAPYVPTNSGLGIIDARPALALAVLGAAGAVAVGVAVLRWGNVRARSWGVRIAVVEAIYLALVGMFFGQVLLMAVVAAYLWGAHLATRPASGDEASS